MVGKHWETSINQFPLGKASVFKISKASISFGSAWIGRVSQYLQSYKRTQSTNFGDQAIKETPINIENIQTGLFANVEQTCFFHIIQEIVMSKQSASNASISDCYECVTIIPGDQDGVGEDLILGGIGIFPLEVA